MSLEANQRHETQNEGSCALIFEGQARKSELDGQNG
jgi:hypothetical protein